MTRNQTKKSNATLKSNASKNSSKNATVLAKVEANVTANSTKNASKLALNKKNGTSNATNLAQEGQDDIPPPAVSHTMLVLTEDSKTQIATNHTVQQNATSNTTTLSQSIINMTKNGTSNHSKNRSSAANKTANVTAVKMVQRQAKNQQTISNLVKTSQQNNATVVNQKASVKLNDVKSNVSKKDVDVKVLKQLKDSTDNNTLTIVQDFMAKNVTKPIPMENNSQVGIMSKFKSFCHSWFGIF